MTRKLPSQVRLGPKSTRLSCGVIFLIATASSLALYTAFPPLGLSPLAWIAPLGWLWIINRNEPIGPRGYGMLWLAGCFFWLPILHGVRLGYWPLVFGWIALSMYLAIYLPLFVGITRILRWRWQVPLVLAAPTVWVGLELIRGVLLTGYAANTLAHSQVHNPLVIQLADQLGGGGIGFVMLTVTAAIVQGWLSQVCRRSPAMLASAGWAVGLLAGLLGYGWWRLEQAPSLAAAGQPGLRVLLVQENMPSMFDNYSRERNQQAWEAYLNLTHRAMQEHGPVDLIVWPESTFTGNEPWATAELTDGVPAELQRERIDQARLLAWVSDLQEAFHYKTQLVLAAADGGSPTHLLVGSDALVYRSDEVKRYNSALFVGPDGALIDSYAKMHLVMFGEYIPLGFFLQWLRDAVGLSGMDAGTQAKCFRIDDICIAPNICFESMVPHLISWQVRKLTAEGTSPAVLINLTNDSWFRGSSLLDHHLACSMLCAVENRRPLLVAANTGISASIDGCGRLVGYAQRSNSEALLARPILDSRWGLVQSAGYPLSWLAALVTLLSALSGMFPGLKMGAKHAVDG